MRSGRGRALAFTSLLFGVSVAAAGAPQGAHAGSSSPSSASMAFTPNVRADGMEGAATGQNEPVDWVDQSGRTYITWQSAHRPGGGFTNTVSTPSRSHGARQRIEP